MHPAGAALEKELLLRADVVFTREQELFERRRTQHHTVRLFPDATSCAEWDRTWRKMVTVVDETLVTRLAHEPAEVHRIRPQT